MAMEFFLTSIDELDETINDSYNAEERKRVVSWDLKRDSIIQSNIDQATERSIDDGACTNQVKDLVQVVM